MNLKEKEIVNEEIINSSQYYNIGLGGQGGPMFKGRKHSVETKIILSNKTKNISKESREKISLKARNRKHSQETKEKIKLASSNRRHSEETKQKISNSVKGFKHSEETKQKIRNSRLRLLGKI